MSIICDDDKRFIGDLNIYLISKYNVDCLLRKSRRKKFPRNIV